MSDISKQICELCGIEIQEEPSRTYDNDGDVEMYITYIDFKKPNNFVKLMELPLKENPARFDTIGEYLYYENFVDRWVDRDEFLQAILEALQHGYFKESLKKLIQGTEWEI